MANDRDEGDRPLSAVLVSDVAHGTLDLAADGGFSYQPAPGFSGSDLFVYRVDDGLGESDDTVVTLTVVAVNDLPIAVGDEYVGTEDTRLTIEAPGVLANDDDVDDALLTAELVSGPEHGTLTLQSDGGFSYVPDPDFNGADAFAYAAHDGLGSASPVLVSLSVAAVNDAPTQPRLLEPADGEVVAAAGAFAWEPSTDVDGDALTYTLEVTRDGATVLTVVVATTDHALSESERLPAGRYSWRVTAGDGALASPASAERSFEVGAPAGTDGCGCAGGRDAGAEGALLMLMGLAAMVWRRCRGTC